MKTDIFYAEVLYKLTTDLKPAEYDDAVGQFVLYLKKEHALKRALQIELAFQNLVKQKSGVINISVTSAQPLNDKSKEIILAQFGKTVEAEYSIDESLIGGVRVRQNNTIFDLSLNSQLKTLQNQLCAGI